MKDILQLSKAAPEEPRLTTTVDKEVETYITYGGYEDIRFTP